MVEQVFVQQGKLRIAIVVLVGFGLVVAAGSAAYKWGLVPVYQLSEGDQEGDHINAARSLFARHDIAGAQITLRNVLQANPSSLEGRLLFVQTLLAEGDNASAEVELSRAADLQAPPSLLWPLQAELLLAQGKATELIDRFSAQTIAEDILSAEMGTWLARAQLQVRNFPAATQALQDALARVPGHRSARLVQARMAAATGQAAANAQVDALLNEDPSDAQAWLLRGDLASVAEGQAAGAIAAYRKAIELRPSLADAHAGVVALLLRQGDVKAAAGAADAMRAALPRSPVAAFLQALSAFQSGDYRRARDRLRGVQVELDPRALMLSAVVAARLEDLAQAESQLLRVVQMLPDMPGARRELAAVYLRRGGADQALASLQPLLSSASNDAQAWRLAGQAHVRLGDLGAADDAYQRARKLQPGDKSLAIASAQLRIARGESEVGLRELKAATDGDPKSIAADLALISAHMQRGDRTAALAAAEALVRKAPDAVEPLLVVGHLQTQAGQSSAARESFEAALKKDPENLAAVRRLVGLDLAANQPDKARSRYQDMLQIDPRAARVMLDLAELGRRLGESRTATSEWIDKAVQVDPRNKRVWVAAIQFHLTDGNDAAVLARARSAAAALPQDPDVLQLLAEAEFVAGNLNQSLASLGQLLQLRPSSPEAYIRQARILLADRQAERALAAADKALELAPDSGPAARAVVQTAMAAQRHVRALAIARSWQQRHRQSALGWQLEAEIQLTQKQPLAAAAALRTALTKGAGSESAWLLVHALNQGGRAAEAQTHIEAWLREHPDDVDFLNGIGTIALSQGDLGEAETRYRQALKVRPDAPQQLNNLALLLVRRRNPEALALAERAAKAAPYSPTVLDTLAAAYAGGGDVDKAVATQELVVDLAPRSLPYRLLLVQYLLAAGDKSRARDELGRAQDQLGQQATPALMRKLQLQVRG